MTREPDDFARQPRAVLVVVPALNEAESVAPVIAAVRSTVADARVVVVDDGSTDGTGTAAREAGATVLAMPFNVGVGGALRAGLLLASRTGVDAVVQCDADGQHPVAAIPALVAALDGADLVIGSRFADGGDYPVRGPRRWAMGLLARVLSRVHRRRLTDVTSGFRAFGPRAIAVLSRELPPEYLGDTVDALVIAKRHRLVVAEVPVTMTPRALGAPTHRPTRAALYLARAVLVLGLSLMQLAVRRGDDSRW